MWKTGDRFLDTKDAHIYDCVVLNATPEELVIYKVDKTTETVRYDVFHPNPEYDEDHFHEFMDNGKYGVHFPEATRGDKRRFYNMTKHLDEKDDDKNK